LLLTTRLDAAPAASDPPAAVLKRIVTITMLVALAAAVTWLFLRINRPYDPGAAPVGGISVLGASLTRDRSFYWLDLDLDGVAPRNGAPPKLSLRGANGRRLDPATWSWPDATMKGELAQGSVRFWLDSRDLAGTLALETGRGPLDVKRSAGIPKVKDGRARQFRSPNW
jgi:hypothetical protein